MLVFFVVVLRIGGSLRSWYLVSVCRIRMFCFFYCNVFEGWVYFVFTFGVLDICFVRVGLFIVFEGFMLILVKKFLENYWLWGFEICRE